MNDGTLVVICGYAGDAHQINTLLPYFVHHKRHILVLSPDDAPILPKHLYLRDIKNISFQTGGKRAYTGQLSLDRQIEHMKILLQTPGDFKTFLMHDSDSVVLSSVLPNYLYNEPDVLWSNVVSDAMHDPHRPAGYPWPHLAFQPPYFTSRATLQKLVDVGPTVSADSHTPFIDWAMMAWAVRAGIPWKNYPDGASAPTTPGSDALRMMTELAGRHGRYILHSVKTPLALKQLAWARVEFLKRFKKTP